MLDNLTKRRIDNTRQILVGKVPDPKSQVEQITTALIYKFMDDMDQESVALGGKASFFTGDFARFAWPKIVDQRLGGQERLNLYVEALTSMGQNPNLPPLFLDIFKGAFLPYRDPETLRLFLHEIDGFTYTNSENLGDAYEYLLQVMGAQGDAGQFRTPRHIIDFIVAAVNPQKGERILDPACGTAGFLISAYKHILADNMLDDSIVPGSALTPEERKHLTEQFVGYDIAPEMVRISRVNMYLHQFPQPTIHEYDTLTSEERWQERFDVIMANPPFMSPKGGIRPHGHFAVQANRSEVLFVDYITEHLLSGGRAGVIVPEGIIFQSTNAYKALRKMLVDEGFLYAVVSLPQGVFNPYAGVKTSILLLDRALAKQRDDILFVTVERDGYDLGAQRAKIDQDDLPAALAAVKAFQQEVFKNEDFTLAETVEKTRIGDDGDYNLASGRYREVIDYGKIKWPMVKLGEIAEYINGYSFSPDDWEKTGKKIIRIQNLTKTNNQFNYTTRNDIPEKYQVKNGDLLISWSASIGFYIWNQGDSYLNQHIFKVLPSKKILKKYLYYLKKEIVRIINSKVHGNTMRHITKGRFESIKIPLPPLVVQEEIVAEIERYQKVIDGARMVVENWRPNIEVDPDWPLVMLGDITKFMPSKNEVKTIDQNTPVSFVPMSRLNEHQMFFSSDEKKLKDLYSSYVYFRDGDVLLARVTPCFENGKSAIARNLINGVGFGSSELFIFRPIKKCVLSEWVYFFISSDRFINSGKKNMIGTSGLQRLSKNFAIEYKIPLPSLKIQKQIIEEIIKEKKTVDTNKNLITQYEEKISRRMARVWGEGD